MIILGIDTATATASVALVEDTRLVCEEISSGAAPSGTGGAINRANHAATLLPLIDKLLDRSGFALSDITAWAVAIGPGSFTGLRVGLSTVKGLVYGSKVPVIGVSTLQAVAARVNDREGFICPFLDARKKEVYAALFHRKGDSLERVSEDLVAAPDTVVESVRRRANHEPCLFLGDGILAYEDLVKAGLGEKGLLTRGAGYPSTATAVARLGAERILRQDYDATGPLVPLYLRASEAELKKKS